MNDKPRITLDVNSPIYQALERLFDMAVRDTGGARRASQFLLSLWNGYRFRVNLQEMLRIDQQVFDDMTTVTTFLFDNNYQLESIVSRQQIIPVIDEWGEVFNVMKPGEILI